MRTKFLFQNMLFACFFFYNNDVFTQQNLILNGDFEEFIEYQVKNLLVNGQYVGQEFESDTFFVLGAKKRHDIVMTKNWNYQDVASPNFNAFYSKSGNSKNGFGYGVLYPFYQSSDETFEVRNLVGEFCHPLKKDNVYRFTFWAKPFKGNVYADALGVRFIENEEEMRKSFNYGKKTTEELPTHYVTIQDNKSMEYESYTIELRAKGNEKYVMIGNPDFIAPRKYKKKEVHFFGMKRYPFARPKPSCMYLIDAVSIVNISNPKDSCNEMSKIIATTTEAQLEDEKEVVVIDINYKRDTTILIEVFFESSEYDFKESEIVEEALRIERRIDISEVKIIGHTDEVGEEDYNLNLSKRRALKVKQTLSKHFLGEYKIDVEYKGEENVKYITTDKNRRVEVYIKGIDRSESQN